MSQRRPNPLLKALDASFVLGAACTVAFYAYVLSPGMEDSLLYRYTAEHAVEYVVVALSFWGLMDMFGKLLSFPREILSLRHSWLPERTGREPVENAKTHLASLREQPKWLRESILGRRLIRVLEHVAESGAGGDYRDHLDALAHQDSDRIQANYTLLKFIVRVTPVLGFLGTVIHFGTALNGVSLDQMSDRLGMVVSEMGQAFNTTTAALGSAMFMMFAQFICEWVDRSIVASVDRYVQRELLTRFEAKDANILPFLSVIKTANEESLGLIAANLERQTALWSQAFERMLKQADERRNDHSRDWAESLDALNARHQDYDAVREERLRQMMDLIETRQQKYMDHIHAALEKAVSLRDDFADVVEAIGAISRGEGRLVEVQATLAENLRLIRETQKIDEALHGLTAAIHLLTARRQGPSNLVA